MNKKKTVCGIDVSHKTFNAHFGGRDYRYSNDRKGFCKLLRDTAGAVYAMEATGSYYYRLACHLHSKGCEVIVCNPYRVSCYIKSIGGCTKTDRHDARMMIRYAGSDAKLWARLWEPPPSKKLERAKAIVSLLSSIRGLVSASKNVQHSAKLVLNEGDKLLNVMPCISDAIEEQRESLEKELYGIMTDVYPEKFRNLQTIPGIAEKSAAALLVLGKGMECWESSGSLVKFFGMVPKVTQSGTSVHGSKSITKAGSPYMRGLLYMCAGSAMRCCKPCEELYGRLVGKGKNRRLAITAVMHRLVKIAFGVVQSGEPFRGGRLAA